jgi:hypothetical protein
LAFKPLAIATAAIDTPDWVQAFTTSARKSSLWHADGAGLPVRRGLDRSLGHRNSGSNFLHHDVVQMGSGRMRCYRHRLATVAAPSALSSRYIVAEPSSAGDQ